MRALVFALGLAAAGCTSWVVDGDTGWLALSGTPRDLEAQPSLTVDTTRGSPFWVGPDGRTYLFDRARDLALDSSDLPPVRLRALDFSVAPHVFQSSARLTTDGVLTLETSDDPSAPGAYFIVHRLGAGPDLRLPAAIASGTNALEYLRGPGYITVHYTVALGSGTSILFDDGHRFDLPASDGGGWTPLPDALSTGPSIWGVVNGDARWLLGTAAASNMSGYGAFDLHAGTFVQLTGVEDQVSAIAPDWPHARAVVCDLVHGAYAVDFASGARHDLGVPSCVRLFVDSGQDGLIASQDGGLWHLAAGANLATFVRTVAPVDLRSVKNGRFLYAAPDDPFSGFLDGQRVIAHGIADSFSADGRTLRWLENATSETVGDLYRRELATGQVRHLQHNVTEIAELGDGRVAAIADAAFAGAWNRAVLLDEKSGVAHWLANDVQHVHVVGDTIIVGRDVAAGNEGERIWALPAP